MKSRRVIRLTEGDLHRIVKESAIRVLNEEGDFKDVDFAEYMKGLTPRLARKHQRVNMEKGKNYAAKEMAKSGLDKRQIGRMLRKGKGAPLRTIASDGTDETVKNITMNDVVLNNVNTPGNRWSPDAKTFKKKYAYTGNGNVFKPKGNPMYLAKIDEPIEGMSPWGEKQRVMPGGYLAQDSTNPSDIYAISPEDAKAYMYDGENKPIGESYLRRIVKESINRIISELNHSTMQSAYDKMIQQGRFGQAASTNDTFNDMYNGYDSEGNFVNQTDLSGRGRHYFLNHSDKGESTISNSESTYGDETSRYNPNVADSHLGKRNDSLAQKAQQIQDWQYGKDGSTPYRTNSNMTPSHIRNANKEWRKKERMQRIGK